MFCFLNRKNPRNSFNIQFSFLKENPLSSGATAYSQVAIAEKDNITEAIKKQLFHSCNQSEHGLYHWEDEVRQKDDYYQKNY